MFFKEVVTAISFFYVYGLWIFFMMADVSLVKDFLFQVYFNNSLCND